MSTKVELRNGQKCFAIDLNGSYNLAVGSFELAGCRAKIDIDGVDDSPACWEVKEQDQNSVALVGNGKLGKWNLDFALTDDDLSIKLYGKTNELCRSAKLYTLCLNDVKMDHIVSQGVKMGRCKLICPGKSSEEAEEFQGFYQLMLTNNGENLQLSYPLRQNLPAEFSGLVKNGKIASLSAYTETLHYGKNELETEALTLKASGDGFKLMTDYAENNVDVKKDFSSAMEPGWNSWDYYRWTITEDEVLENAELIANDPVLSKHVKRIIVDDGWQYCYGEWEANHLFPNGMKYLADELTKMGFKPGLWFAPTIIEPHCRIAQMHYDMLACGESGDPCLCYQCMQRHGFVLDPTQEKVQKHLFNIFKRYTDMGYKYFKLDFMGSTFGARKFADSTASRTEIQEMIVKPIYEAAAGKASILGCNYHFEGGNRFVDSVRVGSDIHATWQAIKHNTVTVAARYWSNKILWINDPDFALCRSFDTADDPALTQLLPSLVSISADTTDATKCKKPLVDVKRPQIEILLSVILAAGGAINLSDKMTRLNESGLDLARRTVSAEIGQTAIPLDLFESEEPSIWLQQCSDHWRVLLINWEDTPKEMSFNLNDHGLNPSKATNFWNGENVPISNSCIKTTLEPRSCLFTEVYK